MNITIHANHVELTDTLREYTEKKINSLLKYFDRITSAAVDIGRESNHHQKGEIFYAEVNLHLSGGPMIRIRKETEDLYKAIDKVKDHLKEELDQIKGKMRAKDREVLRNVKEYQEEV